MTHYTRVPLRDDRGRPRRRRMLPVWLLGGLAGIFVVAMVVSAFLVFSTVRDLVANWKVTRQGASTAVAAVLTPGTPAPGTQVTPTAGPSPTPIPTVAVETWTGTERVTILVMGIDRRAGEDEKGYLTDTMMLVTLDPQSRTAAMLSIPRDLWVEVPGYDVDTINTANRSGDYYDYPGGGPALAVKTVEHNLGVNVNYYVRLDFTAFETMIDTIGGIDIYNQTDIDDPEYPDGSYGYEPFQLSVGAHHLMGHDALRYARTRHGATDIERAQRQQEVVMAVRERVLNLNMLPTLIAQAPLLYQTLNQSVWTDLSLKQMVSLALLGQDIPRENIKSAVIDYRYVTEGTSPQGRQVLIPLRDKIRELRDELFSASSVAQPVAGQDDATLIRAEAARLEVLNGAGVEGLACATQTWLIGQGLNVVSCDTADRQDYTNSVIVDYSGKPYTVNWLKRIFGVTTIINSADPNSPVDIKVIVGADWSIPVTGSSTPP
jgi:polyisoprenyl-teichoic acid--peptidoglycan teichoic acid transferase